MATTSMIEDRPNGPVVAALLAGGIGSAAMGIITLVSELSESFAASLKFLPPVGPLSGKTIVTSLIFFASWVVLHLVFRGKESNFSRAATVAFALIAVGLLGTFPPFWALFTGGE